mmetsp:Transcript_97527/g.232206  ORF Transcript_97527/g.232206 Transcript_97527/m.232206 type:complete len:465 (+) Transcript_97527:439-1833(+)
MLTRRPEGRFHVGAAVSCHRYYQTLLGVGGEEGQEMQSHRREIIRGACAQERGHGPQGWALQAPQGGAASAAPLGTAALLEVLDHQHSVAPRFQRQLLQPAKVQRRKPLGSTSEMRRLVARHVARGAGGHEDRPAGVPLHLRARRKLAEDLSVLRPGLRRQGRLPLATHRVDGLRRGLEELPHDGEARLLVVPVHCQGDGLLVGKPLGQALQVGRVFHGALLRGAHVQVHPPPVFLQVLWAQTLGDPECRRLRTVRLQHLVALLRLEALSPAPEEPVEGTPPQTLRRAVRGLSRREDLRQVRLREVGVVSDQVPHGSALPAVLNGAGHPHGRLNGCVQFRRHHGVGAPGAGKSEGHQLLDGGSHGSAAGEVQRALRHGRHHPPLLLDAAGQVRHQRKVHALLLHLSLQQLKPAVHVLCRVGPGQDQHRNAQLDVPQCLAAKVEKVGEVGDASHQSCVPLDAHFT